MVGPGCACDSSCFTYMWNTNAMSVKSLGVKELTFWYFQRQFLCNFVHQNIVPFVCSSGLLEPMMEEGQVIYVMLEWLGELNCSWKKVHGLEHCLLMKSRCWHYTASVLWDVVRNELSEQDSYMKLWSRDMCSKKQKQQQIKTTATQFTLHIAFVLFKININD